MVQFAECLKFWFGIHYLITHYWNNLLWHVTNITDLVMQMPHLGTYLQIIIFSIFLNSKFKYISSLSNYSNQQEYPSILIYATTYSSFSCIYREFHSQFTSIFCPKYKCFCNSYCSIWWYSQVSWFLSTAQMSWNLCAGFLPDLSWQVKPGILLCKHSKLNLSLPPMICSRDL